MIQKKYTRENIFKLLSFLGALFGLFAVIVWVENMLVSFVLAFVTYYLLAPFVNWMERKGLPRFVATTIPFLAFTVFITVIIAVFSPTLLSQFKSLQMNFSEYQLAAIRFLQQIQSQLSEYYPLDIQSKIIEWGGQQFHRLPEMLSQSMTVTVLAPFLAYFMLLDGREFVRKILSLTPNSLFELTLDLNHQIATQMGGFIRARLLESTIVGLVIWIGLAIMGFPYSILLAVLAGILNIIPYIGPILGALPAFVIAFANHEPSNIHIMLLIVYFIAQVIDAALLVPFLVARIVNLHPVTVVLVLIIGASLMGILGMIISIPVASALKVTTIAIYRHITGSLT